MSQRVSTPGQVFSRPSHRQGKLLALCFLCLTLEGYDLVSYGAALPSILEYSPWGLTPVSAGVIGSLMPFGMLFGSGLSGVLSDRIGRRRMVLASTALFSLAMIGSAFSISVEVFGISRFVLGVGIGAVLPTIAALVYEFAPPSRRNTNSALAFMGVGVGGALAAVVASTLGSNFGFRSVFLLGGLAGLAILVLLSAALPESPQYLRLAGQHEKANNLSRCFGLPDPEADMEPSHDGLKSLLTRKYLPALVVLSAACFFGLLMMFAIQTWLPQLMRQAGYPLGSALTFLVVVNLGMAVGVLLAAAAADRFGSRKAIAGAFLITAASVVLLSIAMPAFLLYVTLIAAGIGAISSQLLINVLTANTFPVSLRGTAIGVTLSGGRLGSILGPSVGGWILTMQLSPSANFYLFAIPALLGLVVVFILPTRPSGRSTLQPSTDRKELD